MPKEITTLSTEPRQKRKYTRRISKLARAGHDVGGEPTRFLAKRRKYRKRVKAEAAPVQPIIVPVRFSGITLDIWQKSASRTDWAAKMIKEDPNFQDMMSVIANSSTLFRSETLNPTNASYFLGIEKGLQEARKIIFALATYAKDAVAQAEPDYLADAEVPERPE